jgi:hypothetical protein
MQSKDQLRPTVHPIRTREEIAQADECMSHVESGVSHREVINDKVLQDRAVEHLMKGY